MGGVDTAATPFEMSGWLDSDTACSGVSSVEVEENVQEVVSRIAEALEGHTG